MKEQEHLEQAGFFQWVEYNKNKHPVLPLMFAISNGGHRHISVAKKLKVEDVKSGVPDICVPCASGGYNGLFIKMKSKKEKISDAQNYYLRSLRSFGYKAEVCFSCIEAVRVLSEYLDI